MTLTRNLTRSFAFNPARGLTELPGGASGPSISMASTIYEDHTDDSVAVTLRNFTPGETWDLTISSTGGGTDVTDTGTVPANGTVSTTQDLSGLGVGTLSVSAEEASTEVATKAATMAVSEIWVFSCIGQSNMLGRPVYDGNGDYQSGTLDWTGSAYQAATSPLTGAGGGDMGMQITFSDQVYANNPQVRAVAFIQTAVGGSGILTWNEAGTTNYDNTITEVNQAMTANSGHTFKGFLWWQGEANDVMSESDYAGYLDAMIADMRSDVTDADSQSPFVVGGLQATEGAGPIAALADTPARVGYTEHVSVSGLTTFDGTHWDAASLRTAGERFYTAWVAAENFTPVAPEKVGTVTATPGDGQVVVDWEPPRSPGSAITDYEIQYSSNSGSSWTTFSDGTSAASNTTVTGLTNDTAYVFRVRATNGAGTGEYSDASSPATPVAGAGAFTDDFNRSNENIYDSADWTAYGISFDNIRVVSNRVQWASGGGDRFAACPENEVDGYAQAKWYNVLGSQGHRMVVRATDTSNFVSVRVTTGGALQINKEVSGANTTIYNASLSSAMSEGDTVRLEAQGDTVRVKINGVTEATASLSGDLTTGGLIGLGGRSAHTLNIDILDDFEAGAI